VAIAYVTGVGADAGGTSSSLTFSFTVSGTNTLLAVMATQATALVDISSATYNGVSMTAHTQAAVAGGSRNYRLFTLKAPAAGTHDIVITYASASSRPLAVAGLWQGVDQTTPVENVTNNSGNDTTHEWTVASETGDLVAALMMCGLSTTTIDSWTSPATERLNDTAPITDAGIGDEAGASSVTIDGTLSNTNIWRGTAFNMNVASGTNISVDSAEFNREFGSAGTFKNIVSVAAEFDREIQSVSLTQGAGAEVFSAEFDREFQSASLVPGLNIQSAEFDREFGSVGISRVVAPGSSEYDREFGSAGISAGGVTIVNAEFDREFGSVSVAHIAEMAGQSAEFDREWRSVSLPTTGTQNVDSAEFDWETSSPLLRQFMAPANTPKSRIKRVRICC